MRAHIEPRCVHWLPHERQDGMRVRGSTIPLNVPFTFWMVCGVDPSFLSPLWQGNFSLFSLPRETKFSPHSKVDSLIEQHTHYKHANGIGDEKWPFVEGASQWREDEWKIARVGVFPSLLFSPTFPFLSPPLFGLNVPHQTHRIHVFSPFASKERCTNIGDSMA